jgi:hypothetical protein
MAHFRPGRSKKTTNLEESGKIKPSPLINQNATVIQHTRYPTQRGKRANENPANPILFETKKSKCPATEPPSLN